MPLSSLDISRVRVLTFDVGGTLLTPHPCVGSVYSEILARHGVVLNAEIIESRFRQAFVDLRSQARLHISEATELAFWRAIVHRALSPECPQALLEPVFADLWEEFAHARRWHPLPGAVELLDLLARPDAPSCAIFSNWDARLYRVLGELGWTKYFPRIFISSELGFEKPHPAAFRSVETALGLPPAAFLHIGDSYSHDYFPARAAGWQAVIVSAEAPSLAPSALRVSRLDDLRPLFS